MLTSLTRVLTATPVVHFVDDYGSIQPVTHATSGFQGFGHLNSTLGFHMKKSKAQPPQQEHKIQGVYIHLTESHVTIRPCPDRVRNIIQTIQQALHTNQLDPSMAQKLAGKRAFTTSQLFGKVGRAANRALYDHTNYPKPLDKASSPWPTSYSIRSLDAAHSSPPPSLLPSFTPMPSTPLMAITNAVLRTYRRRLATGAQGPSQRLWNRDIPSRPHTHSHQWPHPTQPPTTIRQLTSVHLLPWSLDSYHSTSPV